MHVLLMGTDEAASNEAMVADLVRSRSLRCRQCVDAFHAVDRANFWVDGTGGLAYADMPLRHGRLHQSAPHIYARALESLMPLRPGMSFLNVGSGTGYFSSVVAELTGDTAVNDGIDIWPELVAHAGERCQRIGRRNIEFSLGNAFMLDVDQCGRYDRIYVGACGDGRSQNLYKMLEIGGILVGPFQSGQMQQLLKVVRVSETQFTTEALSSVQFASLVEPPVLSPSQRAAPLILRERPWTLARDSAYPVSFRRTAEAVLRGASRNPGLACLPPELWAEHILPCCSRRWFEAAPVAPPSSMRKAFAVAGRAAKHVSFLAVRRGRSVSDWSESTSTAAGTPSSRSSRAESFSFSDDSGDEQNTEAGLLLALLDARGPSTRRSPATPRPSEGSPAVPGSRLSRMANMLWQCAGRCCGAIPGIRLLARWGRRDPVPASA